MVTGTWNLFTCDTSRLDRTVDGNGCWSMVPNHSGWLLPCRLSQFLNAKTKRSAWVGVNVILVYSLLMSVEASLDFERKIFSWPWSTIMSPSYTLFEVQCSYHLGIICRCYKIIEVGLFLRKRDKLISL